MSTTPLASASASSNKRVGFKKKKRRSKKNKNIRKTSTLDLIEKEKDVEAVSLQEAKFLQRHRRKHKGIGAETLNLNTNAEEEVQKEKILGQEFRVENQKDLINHQMESWIEEQLEIQRTGKAPEKKKERKLTEEEELYKMPEFLKVKSKAGMEVDGAGWLTGISEVALDISVKMDNIARTEAAKAALFSNKRPREDHVEAGNYSSNFRRHQREYRDKIMKRRKAAGPEELSHRRDRPVDNVPFATDDRVAGRFIKRYHWR